MIARGDKPVLKLVPVPKQAFPFDVLAGDVEGPVPDFFEPMDEESLALWEGDGEDRF